MNNFVNIFTTRELAIGFWTSIFLGIALFKFKMKDQIINLLKIVFNQLFIKIYLILFLYWAFTTLFLYKVGYWNISFLKDSILWLLLFGIPFCFKVSQDYKYLSKIKNLLIDNIKFACFFEAVINTYCFNFLAELLIVPFVTVLVALNVFADTKEEYKPVKQLTDKSLMFFGFIICCYFVKELWIHFFDISNNNFIRDVFLPFVYTIFFVIPAILLKAYSEYEWAFIHLVSTKQNVRFFLRLRVFLLCWFDFKRLKNIVNQLQISNKILNSYKEINDFLRLYLSNEKIMPFSIDCIGFSPKEASNYLKDEGLIVDDYKYIGSDIGFGEYLGVNDKRFSTGEAINYSIEGNNQEIQKLCLEFSELIYIGEKAQYYSYFVNVAKKLFERALKIEAPEDVFEKIKNKDALIHFYGHYKIIFKKELYSNRNGLAYYQLIIRVKEPKTNSEYVSSLDLD